RNHPCGGPPQRPRASGQGHRIPRPQRRWQVHDHAPRSRPGPADRRTATIGGRPYAELAEPLRTVGALLDAQAAHGSRTPRSHLSVLAVSNGIPLSRVAAVLEETGLGEVGTRRIKTFSLGMRQRLGIAAALL
nr:hypothetical protein [Streptomyces sp. DSM 41633]